MEFPVMLVSLAPFIMVLGIVWVAVNAGTQKRKSTLSTIETAIQAGQALDPETIRALGMPRKDRNGDLKAGLILVAVAAAFVVLGWTIGAVEGDEEARYIMPAVASFPGFIGLVLIGFGLLGSKKDGSE
ncbi:DUF6249 domain-containing protein [Maricaulis maris]|uniref:Uncharacterized protein n=1 Tax=Maricaulis maris TaxID=74318 RepID=A0A495D231_9PROT|nr:DUF6249 domain-containing protein [Maricaulis maris]RKQ95563.1 hypothetical protein C7435_2666 [Maricaulis maris]